MFIPHMLNKLNILRHSALKHHQQQHMLNRDVFYSRSVNRRVRLGGSLNCIRYFPRLFVRLKVDMVHPELETIGIPNLKLTISLVPRPTVLVYAPIVIYDVLTVKVTT